MKKAVRITPDKSYNRLFRFLTFDLRFLTCMFIVVIILLYLVAVFGLFSFLEITEPVEILYSGSRFI